METAKLHCKALDKIGYAIGCERKTCEPDDDYRKRIDAVYRRLLIPHDHEELDSLMIPPSVKTPTWDDVLNQTFAEMRDDAIRMVDVAIDIMEPLQRRDFECAAKYDELLVMRKKAEAMPKNYDEAIAAYTAQLSIH